MSPNQKNLVNSFFEIADTPGISLAAEKGYAIDNILKASVIRPIYVKFYINRRIHLMQCD